MAPIDFQAAAGSHLARPRALARDVPGLDTARLAAEARFLHRQTLGHAAPPALQEAYVNAHRHHGARLGPTCLPRVMQRGLDVEAVELALRARQAGLTCKLQWVLTLAELHGDLHEGPALHPLAAAASLVWVAVMAVLKRAKGTWLVWRHELMNV